MATKNAVVVREKKTRRNKAKFFHLCEQLCFFLDIMDKIILPDGTQSLVRIAEMLAKDFCLPKN
jgi:hypothetical protein